MSPLTQAKILRVLQDRTFQRVGGNATLTADVRVIAATHRNLEEAVARGLFRADLYYRLSVFTLRLPALRERGEDIGLLTTHFLRCIASEMGKNPCEIPSDVETLLRQYPWPGNVRELQSTLKQAMLLAKGPVLTADLFPHSIRFPQRTAAPETPDAAVDDSWDRFIREKLTADTNNLYAQWSALTDRFLLERLLAYTGGNLSRSAAILGINRRTLREKLQALELRPPS